MKTVYAVMERSRSEHWPATLESLHETRESAEALCVAVREAYRKCEAVEDTIPCDEREPDDAVDESYRVLEEELKALGMQYSEGDVFVEEWEVKP